MSFPVFLNHFYLTLDSVTYHDIENSDFLKKEFAAFEKRTTVRADQTYTGIYFYGTHTYFEFFDVAIEKGKRVGDSGIAFGVEEPGANSSLIRRLKMETVCSETDITRRVEPNEVPWFSMLSPALATDDSALKPWIMEYEKHFLDHWHPEASKDRGIGRRDVLNRYKAFLKMLGTQLPERAIMQDIRRITIALDQANANKFSSILRAMNYVEPALEIIPERTNIRGIQEVEFAVDRTPSEKKYRFGSHSELSFDGKGAAIWTF